jgi:cytoskeletal protein CcmA (bactofilin family)/DNA-directed RNA polymerase subunit RPC12/RpoP
MPASKQDNVPVDCPHCGHQQSEPRAAFSTVCKKCGGHFRLEVPKPARKAAGPALERKRITCFDCGAELEVAFSAESTMCKRCSRYVDLKDYHINHAVSKNFKTRGSFVVEAAGYVFNTEAVVGDAVIKGRFLGRLIAERSLTVYSTADIKGSFKTARLIVPAANHFRWKEPIKVGSAEIAGELAATLHATGTIVLKSTARLFGDFEGRHLVVEEGAVMVGNARIESKGS